MKTLRPLLLACLWLSAPALATDEIQLAAPEFNALNVPPQLAQFCAEHLSGQLGQLGVRLLTAREISSLLGMERQKELMGCSEKSASCIAELGSALGADGILLGDLARLGASYQLNLKVLSSAEGKVLARHSATLAREDDLLPELTRAAKVLAEELHRRLGKTPVAPAPTTSVSAPAPAPSGSVSAPAPGGSGSLRQKAWIPAVVGGVAAGAGAVLLGLADARFRELTVPDPDAPRLSGIAADQLEREGRGFQTFARVGFALAGTGVVAAGVMYLLGGPPPAVQPSVALGGSVVGIGVAGVFR